MNRMPYAHYQVAIRNLVEVRRSMRLADDAELERFERISKAELFDLMDSAKRRGLEHQYSDGLRYWAPDDDDIDGDACVYVVAQNAPGDGHFKVGQTNKRMRARLSTLQVGNPQSLFALACFPVSSLWVRRVEHYVLEYFEPWSLRGEWHQMERDELLGEIAVIQHVAGYRLW